MKKDLIYETKRDRGFVFRAINIPQSKGDALIEIEQFGIVLRRFKFPSYKVWNIAAHSSDIIESELSNTFAGYRMAASTGF